MKKKKTLLVLLLFSLFILTACGSNAITTKSNLIDQTKIFKKSINQQDKLLERLSKELNSLNSTVQDLKKNSDLTSLNNDLESRDNTMDEIKNVAKEQSDLSSTFDKTIKQQNKNFPNRQLKQVTQSEDIIQMDYQNFGQYLKKAQDVEKIIKDSITNEDYEDSDLKDDISSLNQYYGAMNQQLEIWQVNLARVKNGVSDLLKELKTQSN